MHLGPVHGHHGGCETLWRFKEERNFLCLIDGHLLSGRGREILRFCRERGKSMMLSGL
jgi:hypothetical protein